MYTSIYGLRTEAFLTEARIVKLFRDGAGQAAWPRVGDWEDFLALVHSVDVPDDFMAARPMNVPPPERGVFDE
jgi:hypothetical protein